MLRVDTERRFLPRFKNRGLAPSNVSRGFSLIEILIALVILSISLLALAALMVTTTQNNSFGGHLTEASTFAQDKIEELRVTPWALIIPNTTGIDPKPFSNIPNYYTRTWTIAQDATGNIRTVTITINWTDQTSHSIRFISAILQ
jgi:type IV pilus assembly protein PilV